MSLDHIHNLAEKHIQQEQPAVEAQREAEERFDALGRQAWNLPHNRLGDHFDRGSFRSSSSSGGQAVDLDRVHNIDVPGNPKTKSPDLELEIEAGFVVSNPNGRATIPGSGMMNFLLDYDKIGFESLRHIRATWRAKETGRRVVEHALTRGEIALDPTGVEATLDSLTDILQDVEKMMKS